MLRRLLLFLIALCLLVPTAFADSLIAQSDGFGNGLLTSFALGEGGAFACDTYNSKLYISSGGVQTLDSIALIGENTYRAIQELFGDGTNVYAIERTFTLVDEDAHFNALELYKLDASGSGQRIAEIQLPESIEKDASGLETARMSRSSLLAGDMLYLLYNVETASAGFTFSDSGVQTLIGIELSTGRRMLNADVESIDSIVAANGEAIILARREAEQVSLVWYENGNIAPVISISAENGAFPCGFAFSAGEFAVYYLSGVRVNRIDLASGKTSFYAVSPIAAPERLLIGDGLYACSRSEIARVSPDSGESAGKLTVSGAPELAQAFQLAHPEIEVSSVSMSDSEITDALLTGAGIPDVFVLNTRDSALVQAIRDRGYYLAQSGETALNFVQKLHPDIAAAAQSGAEIFALPVGIHIYSSLGINESAWNALNLGEKPANWADFLSFLNTWREIADAHPALALFDSAIPGGRLNPVATFESAFSRGLMDEETLVRLLKANESVNWDDLETKLHEDAQEALFTQMLICDATETGITQFSPMPLAFSAGDTAICSASLDLLIGNPKPENEAAARLFCEFAIQNLSPIARVQMMPDENTPLRPDDFAEQTSALQAEIDSLKAALEQASEADQPPLRDSLDRAQQSYDALNSNVYSASERSIALYRAQTQRIEIRYADALNDSDRQFLSDLRAKYESHQITAEVYAKSLAQRIEMQKAG